jgi:hypothetical protein
MANGTIAFDTLTTSDSVKSGAEKSINTSFLFNGSIKAWMDLNGSTFGLRDSFNVSSATDNGGGNYTKTLTNNLSATQAGTSGSACSDVAYSDREVSVIPNATTSLQVNTGQDYTVNRADSVFTNTLMAGDLA